MFKSITSPLLAFLCLVLSVLCQAQNGIYCDLNIKKGAVDNSDLGVVKHVTKGEFMFRKMEKWRVMAFTEEDAATIVEYFMEKENVIACGSEAIDKTVQVFAERIEGEDVEENFFFKESVEELEKMGYFIVRFHESDDILVFPMKNCTAAISIHDFEEEGAVIKKCPPCQKNSLIEVEEDFVEMKNVNNAESSEQENLNFSPTEKEERSEKLLSSEAVEEGKVVEKSIPQDVESIPEEEEVEMEIKIEQFMLEQIVEEKTKEDVKELEKATLEEAELQKEKIDSENTEIEESTMEEMKTKQTNVEEIIENSTIIDGIIDTVSTNQPIDIEPAKKKITSNIDKDVEKKEKSNSPKSEKDE